MSCDFKKTEKKRVKSLVSCQSGLEAELSCRLEEEEDVLHLCDSELVTQRTSQGFLAAQHRLYSINTLHPLDIGVSFHCILVNSNLVSDEVNVTLLHPSKLSVCFWF
ncbi:hypothetical protein ILYODFUR_032091 [Ilyodon furcidens]|uniref:Uncharacterized protein n=1 Tax=Ilyodon furcidens TaxID=33524 RepID=A0ABV0VIV9_9TELE